MVLLLPRLELYLSACKTCLGCSILLKKKCCLLPAIKDFGFEFCCVRFNHFHLDESVLLRSNSLQVKENVSWNLGKRSFQFKVKDSFKGFFLICCKIMFWFYILVIISQFFTTNTLLSLSQVGVPLLSACHGPCMAVHPWGNRWYTWRGVGDSHIILLKGHLMPQHQIKLPETKRQTFLSRQFNWSWK